MIPLAPGLIATLYRAACLAELDALKPGNVHAYAPGHRMAVADFVASADASAPALARAGAGVGARVRDGVAATRAAVGQNTNLGILLLCAPQAAAAEAGATVADTLAGLGPDDSEAVFAAIRLASPGGLGGADRHDVAGPAPASLRAAMAEAAPRDRIARAYVTAFADIAQIGLPALAAARALGLDPAWCASAVHLAYLRAVPDSHVARKHGAEAAEALRREAETRLAGLDLAARPVAPLMALDADLKARGINPGTSADFTVATLFWDALAAAGAGLG
ncbi:triphosphoribosyl-dephospho-CoA synthase [Methylobacterium sp. NEAU 140]|uniref:triphosphoribosyl-dephospho-CoA synthase n=1 Tax=Methylobacterium sp. NEAU 140 TaxID=3064945 RepID=UPI0027341939|nr:triphosphoribosyl-dephospho-CoA synthase [Methylobacterium sp. NEAU 140]MDP4022283.1 triphosphoribosyl-dephospho-CoA synthase [Methylobacterium sp. NEAU 140]